MIVNDLTKRFATFLSIDILVKLGGFLLIPVYLKLLTTEEFGIFSYALSLAMAFSFIVGTGQHIVVSRFFHSGEYSRRSILDTIILTMLGSFFFYGVLSLLFKEQITTLFFKTPISQWMFAGILYLAFSQAINQIFMTYLYQKENVKGIKLKSVFEFLFIHSFSLSLIYFTNGFEEEARIYGIALAFSLSSMVFLLKKVGPSLILIKSFSQSLFKRGLVNGVPVAIGGVSNIFISLGDRYNIEKMLEPHHLGVYSLAISLCSILFLLFNSFQGAWWPVLFKEKELKVSLARIHKIYGIFLLIAVVFGVAIYPAIHLLMKFGIDGAYLETLDYMWILVAATFLQVCGMLIGSVYEIYEKTYISVIMNIIFSILNIILNSYLIKLYGISGAAWATLIISFLILICTYGGARILLSYFKPKDFYQ